VTAALEEFKTRVGEIDSDLTFVSLAAQLRPRVGEIVQWQVQGEAIQLVRKFMNSDSSRPEGVYGSLLVRLIATLERYLRTLVIYAVEQRAKQAQTYDELSPALAKRNLLLSGRVLATLEIPTDRPAMDVPSLLANLATCRSGSNAFRLNSQAFSATLTGAGPSVVEKALQQVDVHKLWDRVGASAPLAKYLATKGPRDTGDRASHRLSELWRWRNHLAHAGDEETTVSETDLCSAIEFVKLLGAAIDVAASKQLAKKTASNAT
jgi:hypothetical protein